MSSNVLKGSFAFSYSDQKVTIDSNETIKKKLEELKAKQIVPEENVEAEDAQGFVEGIDPVQVAQLVGDDEGEAKILGEGTGDNQDVSIIIDQVNAQAEEILEDAKNQAESIKSEAFESGKKDGYDAGYSEGKAAAENEINMLRSTLNTEHEQLVNQLKQEYQQKMDALEPMLVEKLTSIYEHVLGISLSDSEQTIMYLLNKALGNMDVSKGFIIHVSTDDYEVVKENKTEISKSSGVLIDNIEIVEDRSLQKNGCMIETEGGIFDVGLDTQLKLLSKQLKILSMS